MRFLSHLNHVWIKKGILPLEMGWFPEKITNDIDAVILGMHAKAESRTPELGLKIYSIQSSCTSLKVKRVVIGGSHGKPR
jgi:UDP-N-acetylmuramate: L-alanyl-gamma-D-glutamyl-meso-diaminopimelate ligase